MGHSCGTEHGVEARPFQRIAVLLAFASLFYWDWRVKRRSWAWIIALLLYVVAFVGEHEPYLTNLSGVPNSTPNSAKCGGALLGGFPLPWRSVRSKHRSVCSRFVSNLGYSRSNSGLLLLNNLWKQLVFKDTFARANLQPTPNRL